MVELKSLFTYSQVPFWQSLNKNIRILWNSVGETDIEYN